LRVDRQEGGISALILDKFSLAGRSGIVTGGGSGIGKAMARAVVEAGAEVIIAGRNRERLETAAKEIGRDWGRVIPLAVDAASEEGIGALVNRAVEEFGKIDFLFNNAGTIRRAPSHQYSKEDWDEVLRVNLTGPFLLAQAVARIMIDQGRKGKIINTSSLTAVQGGKNVVAYGASKGGLTQATMTMANDWARYNILVNAIGPGWVKTELTGALQENPERYREISGRIPLGRWADPEDLAGTAVFLASDASDYITGQVIFVDGGWLSN
jgi:2-dehydro-3-deoxy-D-gluconate 5-dehydrogenase